MSRRRGSERLRFAFSMITAVFLVGTLAVGSFGGFLDSASARDNNSRRGNNYGSWNERRTDDRTQSNTGSSRTTTNTTTITPSTNTSKTQTVAPAVSQTPAAPVAEVAPQPAPVETRPAVTPQIVAQPVVSPEPVEDTAPAIATMAAAQADKNTESVAYISSALSTETRDRLLIFAGVATITGALLYTISVIGGTPTATRAIPVRYIVPVREVTTS